MAAKNYPISIKLEYDELQLLERVLTKLNEETKIKINKTNLLRILIKRGLFEIIGGKITSSELFFNSK